MTTPLSRSDVGAAHERIAGRIRRTPVLETRRGELGVTAELTLKLDLLQHTGSFKARGAMSLLTANAVPEAGVVAASGGNFGVAAAWAAAQLGHRANVFVPDSSPTEKIEAIRAAGATTHVVPGTYAQSLEASQAFLDEHGGLFAHAYDQVEVVAGQGTCAVELSEQAPLLDTVLVAVGGGGLIGGTATWYAGEARVIGVETERTPALHAALAAGEPVDVEVGGLCVSSLGASRIGRLGFAAAAQHVDRSLLVTDDDVREAQRRLWESCRLVAEPGGAAALAALTSGAYRPDPEERVGVIVCGANTAPASVVRP